VCNCPSLGIAEEVLAAVGDPFHRTSEPLCRHRRQRVFAIGEQLGAEAAADIRRHHAQRLRRDLEHRIGEDVAHEVRALAAERQRVPARRRVVFGDHGAGVEEVGDEALVDDAQRDGLGRRRKRGRGRARFAERHLEGGITGPLRPYLWRAGLEGIERADHVGQRLPIDRDRLGGVLRLLDGVGDDEGDGVADVTNHVKREHRIKRGVDLDASGMATQGSGPSVAISGAVSTRRTPGSARTAISVTAKRAWAWGERNITACSAPGGATSAT
jgi:hypothetical protein